MFAQAEVQGGEIQKIRTTLANLQTNTQVIVIKDFSEQNKHELTEILQCILQRIKKRKLTTVHIKHCIWFELDHLNLLLNMLEYGLCHLSFLRCLLKEEFVQSIFDILSIGVSADPFNLSLKGTQIHNIHYITLCKRTFSRLDLSNITCNQVYLNEITESLKGHRNCIIECLILQQCSLNDESLKLLSSALKDNSSLKELDLSHNQIQIDGIIKLTKSLMENSYLSTLNISNNQIGDFGTQNFATMLIHNTTLESLSMNSCGLGMETPKALARALLVNNSLRHLELKGNRFTMLDLICLLKSLTTNTALQHLYLPSLIHFGKYMENEWKMNSKKYVNLSKEIIKFKSKCLF
jgi:hypothetical protein